MQVESDVIQAAEKLVRRYMERSGGDMVDVRILVRLAAAGYLAGSGVPTDEAVETAERIAVQGLVSPVSPNPLYHGLPWMVAGPVSGAPYYASR